MDHFAISRFQHVPFEICVVFRVRDVIFMKVRELAEFGNLVLPFPDFQLFVELLFPRGSAKDFFIVRKPLCRQAPDKEGEQPVHGNGGDRRQYAQPQHRPKSQGRHRGGQQQIARRQKRHADKNYGQVQCHASRSSVPPPIGFPETGSGSFPAGVSPLPAFSVSAASVPGSFFAAFEASAGLVSTPGP